VKQIYWRLIIIGVVLAWALFNGWPREGKPLLNMSLGLDLKGGSHLVMDVQTQDAVKAECDLAATRLGEELRDQGFEGARASTGDEVGTVVVTGVDPNRLNEAEDVASEVLENWSPTIGDERVVLEMPNQEQRYVRDRAVKQALTTIRNRIDEFGVAEPNIQRMGSGDRERILVQLPGVEDPSRVKRIMQTQARLELRLAHYPEGSSDPVTGPSRDSVVQQFGGQLPPGVEILPMESKDPQTGELSTQGYMAVEKTSIVTGSDLQDARVGQDQWGQSAVTFQLRVTAADRFARFTRRNIGKQMPIILDGKIQTSPVIRDEIGATGEITGNYTRQEAEDLALVLRAGALPARVETIEERTVGPSLGRDSIRAGVQAALIGFGLVVVFMLIYYKLSGINAVVALLLNLLLVAAAMASLGASLTLPGMAGFILVVGMAVDANVLIFERIREELRSGKTVKGALDGGFSKALSAIMDANVTTLIAAIFLFQYGTGPVRGFAVTLSIGILASLFTAIFVSRTLFMLVLGERPVQRLSI
jgi:preprotein translocase subunit SecD